MHGGVLWLTDALKQALQLGIDLVGSHGKLFLKPVVSKWGLDTYLVHDDAGIDSITVNLLVLLVSWVGCG